MMTIQHFVTIVLLVFGLVSASRTATIIKVSTDDKAEVTGVCWELVVVAWDQLG